MYQIKVTRRTNTLGKVLGTRIRGYLGTQNLFKSRQSRLTKHKRLSFFENKTSTKKCIADTQKLLGGGRNRHFHKSYTIYLELSTRLWINVKYSQSFSPAAPSPVPSLSLLLLSPPILSAQKYLLQSSYERKKFTTRWIVIKEKEKIEATDRGANMLTGNSDIIPSFESSKINVLIYFCFSRDLITS